MKNRRPHRRTTLAIFAQRGAPGSARLWRVGDHVLAIANLLKQIFFLRADLDKRLFRRDAETRTPEACATQTDRKERAILVGPLQSRWQMNRRDHAARATTAKFNSRKVKRYQS